MSERVLLAVIHFKHNSLWTVEDVRKELEELVMASRGEAVNSISCPIDKPNPAYLIGEGKVNEIANICATTDINTVVFSRDLKGSQQRNLEEVIKAKTIDRTQLILDIFARRATSQEGKMQVELAQLEYLLPRLVGQGIALSRLGGGIGTSGPGETKLEVDRRRITDRIAKLKKGLKEIVADRAIKRKKRKDQGVPLVSLVGYTNAGKSTLLNTLTQANQKTNEGLFTTLDSLSRQFVLPNNQKIVISDTVGFLHELPHHLIEAFKATLEQVKEADLLLHVLDISHPNFRNLHDAVIAVLKELEAVGKPIMTVLNKIDKLEDKNWLKDFKFNFEHAVCISAKTGENMNELIKEMSHMISPLVVEINVMIPINRMDLVNLAHEKGQVFSVKYYNEEINLRAAVPAKIANQFYQTQ